MTASGNSDVLVVGAGPTGAAAGIALSRAGCRVTVVDRARFPRDKTCGDAVSNDAADLLGRLGTWDRVRRAPHAVVRRAAAVFPDGSRITREYDRPGYIIPRLGLDDALRRCLEESGARVVEGARVTDLRRAGGRVVGVRGPGLSLDADVVIAADGYGSVAWAALGQPKPSGKQLAVSATAYYRDVAFADGSDTADHYFDPHLPLGYGWVFPAVDGISNVGVYLRADGYERSGEKLRELLRGFVARHSGRFQRATEVGRMRVWSLPLAPRPEAVSAPGLLVAGDAGGFIDPLSGEGIWQGIHTGMLAAEAAIAAIRDGDLSAAHRARYEAACRRDVGRPSRGKRMVQEVMQRIVDRRLYRLWPVRQGLALGYRHGALEMTKS